MLGIRRRRNPARMKTGPSRRILLAAVGVAALAAGWGLEVEAQTPPAEIKPPEGLNLTPAQRQLIYASISQQSHQSTAAPANFGPAIGAHVPEAVTLSPMPQTIVDVVPQTRGHAYAFIQGQVLIVEPKGRQIVEVVAPDKPGPTRT